MVKEKVKVTNPTGLHLRPAGIFCTEALKYECSVKFRKGDTEGNAKSILSILGACVKENDEIEIICEGTDEEAALCAIIEIVKSGLGE